MWCVVCCVRCFDKANLKLRRGVGEWWRHEDRIAKSIAMTTVCSR